MQRFWRAPRIAKKTGLKAVEMFRAVATGRIKAIWIIHTNPAATLPEADAVVAALRSCPFVVVSDVTGATDTARLAHLLLPATAWGEKDGTVTNSDRTVSRQRRVLPVPGQARDDWRILAGVAARMGWAGAFGWNSAAEIFTEHAALSGVAGAHAVVARKRWRRRMTHAPNSLPCQCPPLRDGCETLRKTDAHWKTGLSARTEVIPKAVDLMHAFMQDGHDPDVDIREMTPIDEMALIAKEEPFDAELGRDGFGYDAVGCDLIEGCEQAGDVFLGLLVTPPVAGVAVNVIKAMGRPFLNANGGHRVSPGSARSPLPPSAACTSPPEQRRHGSTRPSTG